MNAPSGTSYKFLFAVRNFWYLKYYESVIRQLAQDGHRVHVIADTGDSDRHADWSRAMARLAAEQDGITFAFAPKRRDHLWVGITYAVNSALDHVRFFEPQFDRAPILRRRTENRGWSVLTRLMGAPSAVRPAIGRVIGRALHAVDLATTNLDHLEELLRAYAPDVVVVTPLIALGAAQNDAVVVSRRLGIPTAVAVGSWDHLSSKARIRTVPDRLLVWNETQLREAVDYHGVPADRVVVTGAQCFDQWFDRSPTLSRAEFCRAVGLPDDRPFVLYVGSALFWGSPNEAEFVRRWLAALRASAHETLRNASVLVRPHPKRGIEWDGVDVRQYGNVVVWPPHGQVPLDSESQATYFDSLFHSSAVIGLNTSALIEGGLVGRPVYTVLLPEFRDNQEGTLHFQYLLELEGGLLHAARTLDAHFDQIAAGLDDPVAAAAKNRAFVHAFVRPHGLETPATAVFVGALCDMAAGGRRRGVGRAWWAPLVRAALVPAAIATRTRVPPKWLESRAPVPPLAWTLRAVTRHVAPYAPALLGSERSWRHAERGRRAETAARRQAEKERARAERVEQKEQALAERVEQKEVSYQERARERRERLEAHRQRRRREEAVARSERQEKAKAAQ